MTNKKFGTNNYSIQMSIIELKSLSNNNQSHEIATLFDEYNIDLTVIYDIINIENICDFRFCIKYVSSRTAVKKLIEKWFPPSNEQLRIRDVVDDIYRRLTAGIECSILYKNGKETLKNPNGKFQYRLIIKENIKILISYYYQKATIILFNH